MRVIWVVLLIGVAAAAPQRRGRSAAGGRQNPLGSSEATIAEGRKLFHQSCTACHGLDGTVGDRAPALFGNRRFLRTGDQDLFDAVKHGLPDTAMPPSPLADSSVWKIVAYIRSLRATAYDAPVKGDVARGGQIFWGKGGCGDCHTIQGRGGLLGPDLSDVGGVRTLHVIRDALTKPRLLIPRGYRPVRVVTGDGRTISGILRNEDSFSLQVLDAEGKLRLLAREELREVVYEPKSLMPADYDRRLTGPELEDLLGFLSRQAAGRIRREQLGEIEP